MTDEQILAILHRANQMQKDVTDALGEVIRLQAALTAIRNTCDEALKTIPPPTPTPGPTPPPPPPPPIPNLDLRGLQIFPTSNPWNTTIDTLPVDSRSNAIIDMIGRNLPLHPAFGTTWEGLPNGIPVNVIGGNPQGVRPVFEYASESDPGPYPIPENPLIEAGSDAHLIIVNRDTKKLYELFAAERTPGGWVAGSGAIWDLTNNNLRPAGWTSADAAGLPILPGLVRYDEVAAGWIPHALRFTVPKTRRGYIHPARHFASTLTDPNLPPMGMRVRLKATFNVDPYPKPVQTILNCLKRYGMLLADNGSPWFISGVPDTRWKDDELGRLKSVTANNLEVVRMDTIVTS